jgi:hypothetical protein
MELIKMAMTKIENTKLLRNEAKEIESAVAVDASAGASVDYTEKSDGKILLMITNSHSSESKKATILKGNSLQGTEDLEVSIPSGKTYGIVIESGKFENVSGENAGKVIIKGETTDITVQAVELP